MPDTLRKWRILAHGLLTRPDFRRRPVRAILKRLAWRMRWMVFRKPWTLRYRQYSIAVAKDGQGSLLFYQGFSEPETEDFILRFLKPGMVFFDVGAHIGKYTLLGARPVQPGGEVHSFEPNPDMFKLLTHNAAANNLQKVFLNRNAVSDRDGPMEFEVCAETLFSALRRKEVRLPGREPVKVISVDSIRLDTYLARTRRRADLVKVDVEGAELMVFLGSKSLLALPPEMAPVWVFEYEPENYASFGYAPQALFALLTDAGYGIWHSREEGHCVPVDPLSIPPNVNNLIAAKKGIRLP